MNRTREVRAFSPAVVLQKHKNSPPSAVIHS
jgi:hypothetical protein